MNKIKLAMMGLLVVAPFCLALEGFKSVRATKQFSQDVITKIEQGAIAEVLQALKAHWPLAPKEVEDLLSPIAKQRETIATRYGRPLGIEFIKTQTVGHSLVRHFFIEKFEHHALRWQLDFYKPNKVWVVNGIYWDDKISEFYNLQK